MARTPESPKRGDRIREAARDYGRQAVEEPDLNHKIAKFEAMRAMDELADFVDRPKT